MKAITRGLISALLAGFASRHFAVAATVDFAVTAVPAVSIHAAPASAEIAPELSMPAELVPGESAPADLDAASLLEGADVENAHKPAKRREDFGAVLPQAAIDLAPDHAQKTLDQIFDSDFILKAKAQFFPQQKSAGAPAIVAYSDGAAREYTRGAAGGFRKTVQNGVPADGEIRRREELSPLTNREREKTVVDLLVAGGANADKVVTLDDGKAPPLDVYNTIIRQDAGKPRTWRSIFRSVLDRLGLPEQVAQSVAPAFEPSGHHNVYVVKKGKTDRIVVVGAHYDKVAEGRGAIDNWTGSTMVANLFQAMTDVDTDATFVFAFFSREEEGLLGSRAWLKALPEADRKRIDAMVNLDTLAVNGTFSWKNNSTRSLLDLIMKVSRQKGFKLDEAVLHGGDADSSTFKKAGIPAMTVYGASEDVIFDIIHSKKDTTAYFSLDHYKNAYLLTLELLKNLAQNPLPKAKTIRRRLIALSHPREYLPEFFS